MADNEGNGNTQDDSLTEEELAAAGVRPTDDQSDMSDQEKEWAEAENARAEQRAKDDKALYGTVREHYVADNERIGTTEEARKAGGVGEPNTSKEAAMQYGNREDLSGLGIEPGEESKQPFEA